MTDLTKLSSYQNPEGLLNDRLAPRTDKRLSMLNMYDLCNKRSVLDLGCNNGYFVREALKNGARRAVGVDRSDAILGARELAKEQGLKAEFWQSDLEAKEFKRFCPKFEVVFLLSVITHLKDKEAFLDWLDDKIQYTLIFESNHGEKNKAHIDLVTKHIYFDSVEYLGASDIPEKPHYLWICKKQKHDIRYPYLNDLPVEFIPINKIIGWDEESILKQARTYDVKGEEFKRLKEDIQKRGLRESLIVEDEKDGHFKGFQGGHRYLAAKYLGYKEVPCRVLRRIYFKHLSKQERETINNYPRLP